MALKEINLPRVNVYPVSNDTVSNTEYDFAAIVRLLDEYTQKYSRLTHEFIKPIRYTPVYIALALVSVLLVAFTILKSNEQGFEWSLIRIGSNLLQMAVATATFFQITYLIYQQWKRQRTTSQVGSLFLKGRLQNIIRTASQMYEHSNLTDVQKLELDLRLAEAEMTLQLGEKIR